MADSLADDEAKLAEYGAALVAVVEEVLPDWVERCVVSRTSLTRFEEDSLLFVATHQAQVDALRMVLPKMRVLLRLDIDRQRSTPLEVIRKAVTFPSRVLELAGVEPVVRDAFAEKQFPGDVYDLTPMSLEDVDPRLTEPGLVWGAAKAHVHLRRRREAGEESASRIAAFVPNLMDRGKIAISIPTPEWLSQPDDITTAEADIVIVDVTRVPDLSVFADCKARTIGFCPHVRTELMDAAREAGCSEVYPRSSFFRLLDKGKILVRHE